MRSNSIYYVEYPATGSLEPAVRRYMKVNSDGSINIGSMTGTFAGSVSLNPGDIQIGAVEVKDDSTGSRLNIVSGGDIGNWIGVQLVGGISSVNQEGKISVGNTKTGVIAANSSRRFAIFVNDSDEDIYLSLGNNAAMNEGIRLNSSGGYFEINGTNLYTGSVTAICSSGTKNLTYTEG